METKFCIVFDLNGVIVNDERIHQESWRQLLKKHNFKISEEEFKDKIFGRTEKEVLNHLFNKKISKEELERYSSERVKIAINVFKPKISLTRGLDKFLDLLHKYKIQIAIATSSRRTYLNFILDELNIRKYFQTILSAEDIKYGKPHPEIYLKTAQKLGVKPENCIVFEDSISGIKSAKAARMKVIAITTTHNKEELALADKVITTFEGLTLRELEDLQNQTKAK